jgi:dTDP-4-amino-4,6-dideoxygalactose transaminase
MSEDGASALALEGPVQLVDLQAQRRRLGGRIEQAIARVLDHGQFVMGPEVFDLEERLAELCGVKHAITCSSGTDALLMALLAWGIGPGDAVVVPSFTFASTAEVIALLGATPVFVDVLEDTFNIDPDSIRAGIRVAHDAGLRPRAVIPVDLFGQPADYDSVGMTAREHGLLVLADAAQSLGGSWRGRPVGSLAEITATSFFPSKPLGCYGDGGALFTDDDDMAAVLRSLRVHGSGSSKYDNVRIGLNGRLDTMQAAILLEKLTIFHDELEARARIADRYAVALADLVAVPLVAPEATSAWAQYTLRLPELPLPSITPGRSISSPPTGALSVARLGSPSSNAWPVAS